ncbi:RND family transporter [Halovenus rubra]|uniref:RND family transporter n=2 Tax=Halovenus rubra TaxID=869890 RepID=A0ABD5X5W0_9EURY|nr:MMPL family transporter [Halovenus rubra]
MNGGYSKRYAEWVSTHSKAVIALVLLTTVVVGVGIGMGDAGDAGVGEFEVDSAEFDAADFIDANYASDNSIVSQVIIREEGGDVLTRDSLLTGLQIQTELRADESIDSTLSEQGVVGLENLVGTAAVYSTTQGQAPSTQPSLEEQQQALEALSAQEVDDLLEQLLDPDGSTQVPSDVDPYAFLPQGYVPGETSSPARLSLVRQVDTTSEDEEPLAAYDAQVAIDELVEQRSGNGFVFGQGVLDEASSNATGDSFTIITPFALVLILFVLGVSYRDITDILLAIVCIAVVLVWLQGIMGWLAIPMNVILIAVPFLLIGLSIDYAVHVVMRYREARQGSLDITVDNSPTQTPATETANSAATIRGAMTVGLGTVILALVAATFSTGVGFLSNVVSPLPAIQDFAIVSSGGIFATFVAFGCLMPALKVEVDGLLEGRFGRSRDKPAFGSSGGSTNTILAGLSSVTSRAPVVVLVIALLLTTGGVYGATTIDTEFNQADFIPQDAPEWTEYLPGPLEPGTYTISDEFEYLSQNFQLRDSSGRSTILLREDVASGEMLTAVDEATANVDENSVILPRPDGVAAVEGPHTVIRAVAEENKTFATTVAEADTNGDGLPDENIDSVYAQLFAADSAAASDVLSRTNGEVTSARLRLSIESDKSAQKIAEDTEAFATQIERGATGVTLTAVPTGNTVTEAVLQDALLETLIEAFVVTLLVILVFLTVLFWVRYRSPTQGIIVVIPVVIALTWLLGVMAVLGIPFNSETAVITSLAIGLGVDYSIHAGERFVAEREQRDTVESALEATLTGTGGALLASAATTAAGFGVLALSLSPPLRRFGTVTAAAIIFAFLSVMTVLPSLFILRERLAEQLDGR